jgi:hypothetical protein
MDIIIFVIVRLLRVDQVHDDQTSSRFFNTFSIMDRDQMNLYDIQHLKWSHHFHGS